MWTSPPDSSCNGEVHARAGWQVVHIGQEDADPGRKHGLTVAEIEDWQERLLTAAENALRARPKG